MLTLQEEDELAELEVDYFQDQNSFQVSVRRGYVKLHVLDMPIGPAVGQVIGLSAYDLPRSGKGPPTAVDLVGIHHQPDHLHTVFFKLHILDLKLLHRGLPLG